MPYADHHFTFNPQLRHRYHDMDNFVQSAPLGQSSPELLTTRQTDQLLSFLDGFDRNRDEVDHSHWVKLEPVEQAVNWHDMNNVQQHHTMSSNGAPYSNPHLALVPNPSGSRRKSFPMHSSPSMRMGRVPSRNHSVGQTLNPSNRPSSSMAVTPSTQFAHLNLGDTRDTLSLPSLVYPGPHPDLPLSRTKPLLSTPQKRLNHIMSEQKRRNAIRDGYAQLITLLAPEGSGPGLVMPTRGRPKGSGTKGKQAKGSESEGAKGKSGVLFRAVEYCQWLEEGRNALKQEVEKAEAAAGILSS